MNRALCLLTLLSFGCATNEPYARALVLEDLDQGIGGPKATGRPGDLLLENDRIRVVVLGARRSLGPHTSGGSLIDADLQRNDPRYSNGQGNDQLAEIFATVNMNVPLVDASITDGGTVEVIADGFDGGAAIVRAEGPSEPFLTMLGGLWAINGQADFKLRTDYILEPGAGAVLMRTTAVFGSDSFPETATPAGSSETDIDVLGLAITTGATFGDFYLQGGSVDVFTPDVGYDEDGFVFELNDAGVNTFEEPINVDYLAGTADGVSYALMADQGNLFVPLFTSSQTAGFGAGVEGDGTDERFAAGTAYSYDRWFAVGRGDVGSALDAVLEARGVETGRVEGHVIEQGTGVALSHVHVFVYAPDATAPWSEFQTDVGDDPTPDGSFGGTLPPGTWELLAYDEGRPVGQRVTVTVTAGQTTTAVISSPQPGSVSFQVTDETGMIVPAKLSFFTEDGSDVRRPDLGDSYIAGAPAAVKFAPYGSGQLVLPPGRYYAVASRGPEYDLGISDPFDVTANTAVDLDLAVVRSVDSSGWISADLHVHAEASFDSGTSLSDRVGTMVSEGVEFLSSTDHDAITDYAPVIEDMGLEPWLSSAVGVEVTTLELGHFLGFPLQIDNLADQGGAFDWTGMIPEEIVASVRAKGLPGQIEPVVFVGHPRDGILGYFDQFGLDPFEGTKGLGTDPGTPAVNPSLLVTLTNDLISQDSFTTDFDALELLNGKRFELLRTPTAAELAAYADDEDAVSAYDMLARTSDEQQALIDGFDGTFTLGAGVEGVIDDWFTLLNLGFRYTALGNSDTHGKTSIESGCPRNYVQVGTDDPAYVDADEVAEAVRAGRVVASYGPFVRFWINDEANGPGAEITDADAVTVGVQVSSPDWFDVDRVELYENGTLIHEWTVESGDILQGGFDGVNLDTTIEITPEKDSWYVVIALGDDDLGPMFTPVEIPPIQLQDVVIDALGSVEAVSGFLEAPVPIPRTFPVYPYALANPIRVDQAGDGWTAPGLPDWLVPPAEEE